MTPADGAILWIANEIDLWFGSAALDHANQQIAAFAAAEDYENLALWRRIAGAIKTIRHVRIN